MIARFPLLFETKARKVQSKKEQVLHLIYAHVFSDAYCIRLGFLPKNTVSIFICSYDFLTLK